MSYYTGDINGEFVWEYEEEGHVFRHIQDPFFLKKFGGVLEENCVWEGCHCNVQDNNHPYCMQCYDSAQEHKASVNSNDLKMRDPSYDMRINRDTFEENVRPWLQKYGPIARQDIKYLTFKILHGSVHYDEWECGINSLNFNIIQEYCLLKQIEYYFDYMESQICWFHIFN